MTDRDAFNACTEITWLDGDTVRTERVTSRARPMCGLRAIRTEAGARVNWIDVITYILPR